MKSWLRQALPVAAAMAVVLGGCGSPGGDGAATTTPTVPASGESSTVPVTTPFVTVGPPTTAAGSSVPTSVSTTLEGSPRVVDTEPADGAELTATPLELVIRFDGTLPGVDVHVLLKDAWQEPQTIGQPIVFDNRQALRMRLLDELPAGRYEWSWIVWLEDGSLVSGTAVFTLHTPGSTTVAPPTGDQLVFTSITDGNADLFVVSLDGTDPVALTTNPAHDSSPAWSPDGSKIAFVSDVEGNNQIYVVNADGSELTRLSIKLAAADGDPAWSPDGTKLAFMATRDGNGEIYVMDADGTDWTRLTNDPAWESAPTWSPDGTKIAFVSDTSGSDEIYVMDADGSNLMRLTQDGGTAPAWSPDGTRIAFTTSREGGAEIYVMNPDGTDLTPLTWDVAVGGSDPAWSPDGTRIAFGSYGDIYVMNADGSQPTRVTDSPADDGQPAWRPR